MTRVLLIESDAAERDALVEGLTEQGLSVSTADDDDLALKLVAEGDIDLVVLDTGLSNDPGLRVLREVRALKPKLPVFVLSNLDETGPMIVGLESGADDYITKPISAKRLAARIQARLRREDDDTTLVAGPVTLDLAGHRARIDDRTVDLSAREVSLLAAFMRHEGDVLSRDDLLQMVWNVDFDPGSNVVSVYVRSLRQKIGEGFIETVPRAGYRFVVPHH